MGSLLPGHTVHGQNPIVEIIVSSPPGGWTSWSTRCRSRRRSRRPPSRRQPPSRPADFPRTILADFLRTILADFLNAGTLPVPVISLILLVQSPNLIMCLVIVSNNNHRNNNSTVNNSNSSSSNNLPKKVLVKSTDSRRSFQR